jgi:hypothetical protein
MDLIYDWAATRNTALSEVLRHSHRSAVPIRRTFLRSDPVDGAPGPASRFVAGRREMALDLFLLLHAELSSEPYERQIPIEAWTPLVGCKRSSQRSARAALRDNFRWLRDQRLIGLSDVESSAPSVHLLDEGGAGCGYRHPAKTGDSYFSLPHAYWEDRWDVRLDLPAKFALLIARSLRPVDFLLPGKQGAQWYGGSPATIQRGLEQLRREKLLWSSFERRRAENSPWGERIERRHTLRGAFQRD